MPTRRQMQRKARDWNFSSSSTPSPRSKSSSSSKQMPRQQFVRTTRSQAPVPIRRAHTMGGKRTRRKRIRRR